MVFIVEIGISPIELDCQFLKVLAFMSLVSLRELIYVVIPRLLHLVSVAVIFQLLLSMMIMTPQSETDQSMWDSIPVVEVCIFKVRPLISMLTSY